MFKVSKNSNKQVSSTQIKACRPSNNLWTRLCSIPRPPR